MSERMCDRDPEVTRAERQRRAIPVPSGTPDPEATADLRRAVHSPKRPCVVDDAGRPERPRKKAANHTARAAKKASAGPPLPPQERPEPSAAEKQRIEKATARFRDREPPPQVKTRRTPDGKAASLFAAHRDNRGGFLHLADTLGSRSGEFIAHIMGQIERAMTPGGSHKDDEAKDLALNAGLAFVHAIDPRNELEAVLATQMLAAHEAAMEMLRWTRTAEMVPHMESAGRLAVKLLKTFTAQVDTLK